MSTAGEARKDALLYHGKLTCINTLIEAYLTLQIDQTSTCPTYFMLDICTEMYFCPCNDRSVTFNRKNFTTAKKNGYKRNLLVPYPSLFSSLKCMKTSNFMNF